MIALITSRPHKTMEFFFIFQTFLSKNGMRRDRGSSEAMLTDYWKPTQQMFPSISFSTERRLLATSSVPILHDKTLQMIFYHSQLSLVASLICFPRTLVFPPPLECPTIDILPLPSDTKEQKSVAHELPVYCTLLILKRLTIFKALEVNPDKTEECIIPIH